MSTIRTWLIAALAMVGVSIGGAFAASAQTVVDTDWNGAGLFNFTGTVTAGSGIPGGADFAFASGGNFNAGKISFVNQQNNPFGYNVSTVTSSVVAGIGNGGFMQASSTRDSSHVPMYGPGDDVISTFAQTDDGAAEMAIYTTANYAQLSAIGYGKERTSGGKTLEVSGSNYVFGQQVSAGGGNFVGMQGAGSGSANFKTNFSGTAGSNFSFGTGGGITKVATYEAAGVGEVQVYGEANNLIKGFGLQFAGPGASLTAGGTFGSGAFILDFSTSGN